MLQFKKKHGYNYDFVLVCAQRSSLFPLPIPPRHIHSFPFFLFRSKMKHNSNTTDAILPAYASLRRKLDALALTERI